MYLFVFKNVHDNNKELKIPFWAKDDKHASEKAIDIMKIWYDENMDFIRGSIRNDSVRLFNLKEIKINVPS